jgi:tellurite resistance protein TerC
VEPEKNALVRLFRRLIPMTKDYSSHSFVVRRSGKLFATPLAIVLVTVESSDLVFALDSIPAIFGVTHDPFIVFTSNVCAILGLRAMYFLLAAVIDRFVYLGTGLGLVLAFIGVKMLIEDIYPIPILVSLVVVAVLLLGAILLSLLHRRDTGSETSSRDSGLVESASTESDRPA